jgi:hypothetical protein
MIELVSSAFGEWGIEDSVLAIGQFEPRERSSSRPSA